MMLVSPRHYIDADKLHTAYRQWKGEQRQASWLILSQGLVCRPYLDFRCGRAIRGRGGYSRLLSFTHGHKLGSGLSDRGIGSAGLLLPGVFPGNEGVETVEPPRHRDKVGRR